MRLHPPPLGSPFATASRGLTLLSFALAYLVFGLPLAIVASWRARRRLRAFRPASYVGLALRRH